MTVKLLFSMLLFFVIFFGFANCIFESSLAKQISNLTLSNARCELFFVLIGCEITSSEIARGEPFEVKSAISKLTVINFFLAIMPLKILNISKMAKVLF